MIADSPLPNIAVALKERKKIAILAIGSTSASLRGPVSRSHYAIVERFLESTFNGLDVVIVHRGVSGELAADAGARIKNEVALADPDLWRLLRKLIAHQELRTAVAKLAEAYDDPADKSG